MTSTAKNWRYYTITVPNGGPLDGSKPHFLIFRLLARLAEPYALLIMGYHATLRLPPDNATPKKAISDMLGEKYVVTERIKGPKSTETDDLLVMYCTMVRNEILRASPTNMSNGMSKALHLILNPWGYETEAMIASWMGKWSEHWLENMARLSYGAWDRNITTVTKGSRKTAKYAKSRRHVAG